MRALLWRARPVLELCLAGSLLLCAVLWAVLNAVSPEPGEAPASVSAHAAWLLPCVLLMLAAACVLLSRRSTAPPPQQHGEHGAAASHVERLGLQLDAALARIEEISRSQGRLVGNIAHEIKTPLTTVLSHAEQLQAHIDEPSAVRHYAKSIAADVQHLSDLVESFLRLARTFAQEDTSHHVTVYVHDIVTEAVRRSQGLALEHGVTIVTTLAEPRDADDSVEVLGDALLLESMVENIVRNAVRFSPQGARVDMRVEALRDTVVLRMRDRGVGIPPEQLESVFDWFFRGPAEQKPSSGTGFGLALAKRVVEHHRGTISVRNSADGGCEFEVRLPRWRANEPPPANVISLRERRSAESGADQPRPFTTPGHGTIGPRAGGLHETRARRMSANSCAFQTRLTRIRYGSAP